MELSTMIRDELERRILVLTDEQVREILDKYKYKQVIEIMPDIIIGTKYLTYDYNTGDYDQREIQMVYIYGEKDDTELIDFPYNVKDVMIVDKSVIIVCSVGLYLLNKSDNSTIGIYGLQNTDKCVHYRDNIVLIMSKRDIRAVELKENKVNYLCDTDIKSESDNISIGQTDVIVTDYELLRLDTEESGNVGFSRKFTSIIDLDKDNITTFHSIGRMNKILITGYKNYLYDVDTEQSIIVETSVGRDFIQMGDSHIITKNILYRCKESALIKVNGNMNITGYISRSLCYKRSGDKELIEIYRIINDKLDMRKIKTFGRNNNGIFAVPLNNDELQVVFSRYKHLIPMVNDNIKGTILQFCRDDI